MPKGRKRSGGKKLEGEMLRSLQQVKGWAYRLNDKFTMIWSPRGVIPVSSPSPADLLLVRHGKSVLMETKEVRGTSLPYDRLQSHQLQELLEFRWRGHLAYVVVQYIGVKDEPYLCVAIPIKAWWKEERTSDRKSLNYHRAVEIGIRLDRIKGSMWDVRPLLTV